MTGRGARESLRCRRKHIAVLGLATVLGVGCGFGPASRVSTPPDPSTTFAARETHRGIAIDRMQGGLPGVLVAKGLFRYAGDPAFVLHTAAADGAGVWLTGREAVLARGGTSGDAPVLGRVVPSWADGSIELTIEPAGAPALRCGPFLREAGAGRSTLTRNIRTSLGIRGTYRAALAADGAEVGWLRIHVDAEGAAAFAGAFPPSVSEALAAATAVVLVNEIDWIEEQAIGVSRPPERR